MQHTTKHTTKHTTNDTTNDTSGSMREGSTMRTISTARRVLAGTILLAGVAGGAIVAHADVFSQRAAPGLSQDLSITPKTDWPAIPVSTCVSGTLADTCSISLAAGPGVATVADVNNGTQQIPFWGFNVNGEGGGEYTLAGGATSTIKVPVGSTITIDLTQDLAITDPIDLSFPSLPVADVSHEGTSYTVHATKVGTSVFQAGTNPDAPRQIAMGLVGVLIVTPEGCDTCVYDPLAPAQDEAIVAMTDLDAEFAAAPADFDMAYFAKARDAADQPRRVYHVINGHAFPDTDVIDARAGDTVALRYVNAGVTDKTMGLLGLRQTLVARNASAYTDPQSMIAPMIGPGETADVTVAIPATDLAGQRYALVDQSRQLNHGTASGFGGAMTFLNVWAGVPAVPTVSGLVTDGSTLTANSTSAAAYNITGYQTAVTATAVEPDWSAVTTTPVTPSAAVALSVAGLTATPGQYVWVRVQQDGPGTLFSAAASIVVPTPPPAPLVDPVVDSVNLAGADLTVAAHSDAATTVIAAEYSVGAEAAAAGTGTALAGPFGTVSITSTETLATSPNTGDVVWVRVQDAAGTWSAALSVTA